MDRVVIVTKRTRLDGLVREHLTFGAARFLLESKGQSIKPYEEEHAVYRVALAEIRAQIPNDIPVVSVERENLPHFLFREKDTVIACGPDGLFVNIAKYLGNQPLIAVNPDPRMVAGVLMRFPPQAVGKLIAAVHTGGARMEKLPLLKASIDSERVVWAVNDVFIGRRDHASARYIISFAGKDEKQSSSGLIVSTGVGSSGWMRAIAAMVTGLSTENHPHQLSRLPGPASEELVFAVREPFPSPSSGVSIVTGRITPDSPLKVISEMPDGGYIFSDGILEKAQPWNAGSTVTISVGERYIQRVVG